MGFFQGTQERVRNSRGKQAIGFRAIEVLLYFEIRGCFEGSVLEMIRVNYVYPCCNNVNYLLVAVYPCCNNVNYLLVAVYPCCNDVNYLLVAVYPCCNNVNFYW